MTSNTENLKKELRVVSGLLLMYVGMPFRRTQGPWRETIEGTQCRALIREIVAAGHDLADDNNNFETLRDLLGNRLSAEDLHMIRRAISQVVSEKRDQPDELEFHTKVTMAEIEAVCEQLGND